MRSGDLDPARHSRPDLLARPPWAGGAYEDGWPAVVVDTADQLEVLADLLARGLLSADEFDRQKAKVIDPWGPPGSAGRERRSGQ